MPSSTRTTAAHGPDAVREAAPIVDEGGAVGADDVAALEERAVHVAARLAEVANAKRLLVLCHLAKLETRAAGNAAGNAVGEASVGELQRAVGLSQSALSQHLARLRAAGMVATRRSGQCILYRLADDETRRLMHALYKTFCGQDGEAERAGERPN